jgi:hypothetical protein
LKCGTLKWDGKSLTELRADFTINSYEAHRSAANRAVERERRTESMRRKILRGTEQQQYRTLLIKQDELLEYG